MSYNSDIHHRRSIRLKQYDYSQTGAYFVTVLTRNRECLFGEIRDGCVVLNQYGIIVRAEWLKTEILRDNVSLDEFVIMPNHFHGILLIMDTVKGTSRRAPTKEQFGKPTIGSIPTIINAFKSAVTKNINQMNQASRAPLWQRNYYEHLIRNETQLNHIRDYIIHNPYRWHDDELFMK